jgi:hypothetical protein
MNGTISRSSTTTSYGYLGGSGTFNGAVIVSSGTLAPGGVSVGGAIVDDAISRLTVASLSLGSSATTQLAITGSTSDLYEQIIGSGTLTYGGTLAITMTDATPSYVDGTLFNLFTGWHTGHNFWCGRRLRGCWSGSCRGVLGWRFGGGNIGRLLKALPECLDRANLIKTQTFVDRHDLISIKALANFRPRKRLGRQPTLFCRVL